MDINEKDTEREVTSLSLAEDIVKILDAGKAGQIKMLRVNDTTVMTDTSSYAPEHRTRT